MNNNENITGSVCTDCLMVIANGDTSGIADLVAWEVAVAQANATDNGRYDVVPVGDSPHYSTARCDFCRTTMHGDRHDVVFIER